MSSPSSLTQKENPSHDLLNARIAGDATRQEIEQSWIRVAMHSMVLLWFWTAPQWEPGRLAAMKFVGCCLVAAICFAAVVRRIPLRGQARVMSVAAFDQLSCCVLLWIGGERAIPLILTLPWVTLGNGLRFGLVPLLWAAAWGLGGFVAVILVAEPWASHRYFSIGVLASNLVVPLYVAVLLRRLKRAQIALQERAEMLAHDAAHDGITGLLNRRAIEEAIDSRLHGLGSRFSSVAVLYIDLDGFKAINDTLGHAKGDELLVEVATCLVQLFRGGDAVARIGGDEFCVALTDVEDHFLDKVSQRIRQEVSKLQPIGTSATIGASVGYSRVDARAPADRLALMQTADAAMYRDKQARRAAR